MVTTSGSSDVAALRRAVRRAQVPLRRPLPWVGLADPWAILVSEVMLQQTQSARVLEPWSRFLERFPTPESCAQATIADVLRQWSGLGYPRRARSLQLAAQRICDEHGGRVPEELDDLLDLPGVGEYTARAVASFAFHQRVAVLDTNVGRVLARALANRPLRSREARELAHQLLGRSASAPFNQAMIDLGAQFCRSVPRCGPCPVATACRWRLDGGPDPAPTSASVSRVQSTFVGSDRQLRGAVLRELVSGPLSPSRLCAATGRADTPRFDRVLASLERDGLVVVASDVRLAGD